MYSIQNQYSLPKDLFNKCYGLLSGFIFHKEGKDDTVIFRFLTKNFAKEMLTHLEAASIPYTLLEEKFA